jgi:hypothetical protein
MMAIVNRYGEPATHAVRESLGFVKQHLPLDTDTAEGVRPPEVHPQDFYDAARLAGRVRA